MTLQEEIELIVNTAYLRGCDSNFKTAIAAMHESERWRLSESIVNVCEDGDIHWFYDQPDKPFCCTVAVYGECNSSDAEFTARCGINEEERARLSELVKMIGEGA